VNLADVHWYDRYVNSSFLFGSMCKLELTTWHTLSSSRSMRADVKEKEMFA